MAVKAKPPSATREHDSFPVAFADFAVRLKGTDDEVWIGLLRSRFGTAKKVFSEWRAVLNEIKKS